YQSFEETLDRHLPSVYGDLNTFLVENGVLPDLDVRSVSEKLVGSFRNSLTRARLNQEDQQQEAPQQVSQPQEESADSPPKPPSPPPPVAAVEEATYLNEVDLLIGKLTVLQKRGDITAVTIPQLVASAEVAELPLSQRLLRELHYGGYLVEGFVTSLTVTTTAAELLSPMAQRLRLPLLKYLLLDPPFLAGSAMVSFVRLHQLLQLLQQGEREPEALETMVSTVERRLTYKREVLDQAIEELSRALSPP
ncbi:MAG: DUF1631 family protein, partial [Gammaproteobacteria bacterium]|nr:DUF1631 family protein [Gammaproteobacteria bacterium]